MKHLFETGEANGKKLLLLHGTGGDEYSLVDIARFLDGACTILSFRGEIEEDGMNRFFKRDGLNQFNIESLEAETDKLLAAIEEQSAAQGIPLEDWVLVGYSNGANIAAHLLLERETDLRYGLFFHPMSLGVDSQKFDLSDKKIWASFGEGDPIVSLESFNTLVKQLEGRGAEVQVTQTSQGHQVVMPEITQAKTWLALL